MRDGIKAVSQNKLVFDRCALLLEKGEALVIFPEANHTLNRRVRPLSKGFTRITFRALEKYPDLDIQWVPGGLNYKNAVHFPDEVAFYYGKAIAARNRYRSTDLNTSRVTVKNKTLNNLPAIFRMKWMMIRR